MTDALVTWLRQQLDDDEQVARAVEGLRKPYYFDFIDDAARPFVERELDPARVLADLDAKRRILDEYVVSLSDADTPSAYAGALEHAVRLLTQPYADREGFRPEWRP